MLRLDVHRSWGASPLAKSTGHENKEVFPRRLWTNDGSGQRHFRFSGRGVGGPSGIYRPVVLALLPARWWGAADRWPAEVGELGDAVPAA